MSSVKCQVIVLNLLSVKIIKSVTIVKGVTIVQRIKNYNVPKVSILEILNSAPSASFLSKSFFSVRR